MEQTQQQELQQHILRSELQYYRRLAGVLAVVALVAPALTWAVYVLDVEPSASVEPCKC